jgi:hypothetical protein
MFGSEKYAPNNWRKGLVKSEILDSLVRHCGDLVDAMNEGKAETDHESMEHLIGHIMCNSMFYAYHDRNNSFVPEPVTRKKRKKT